MNSNFDNLNSKEDKQFKKSKFPQCKRIKFKSKKNK